MTSSMISKGACLDNNHTLFILVDDGTINKYGGEISFRASLENCVSRRQMEKSCGRNGYPSYNLYSNYRVFSTCQETVTLHNTIDSHISILLYYRAPRFRLWVVDCTCVIYFICMFVFFCLFVCLFASFYALFVVTGRTNSDSP